MFLLLNLKIILHIFKLLKNIEVLFIMNVLKTEVQKDVSDIV